MNVDYRRGFGFRLTKVRVWKGFAWKPSGEFEASSGVERNAKVASHGIEMGSKANPRVRFLRLCLFLELFEGMTVYSELNRGV